MKTRRSWGIVVLAGLFAATAIGVATATYFFEKTKTPTNSVATAITAIPTKTETTDTDGDGVLDWKEALIGTDPKNPDSNFDGILDTDITVYPTPEQAEAATPFTQQSLSTTEMLAEDVAANYRELAGKGTFTAEERDAVFAEAIERNIVPPDLTQNITIDDINIQPDAKLDEYTALVILILRESVSVKEYELATFARSVNTNNFSGTPALKNNAMLYARIERALLATAVPPVLAEEHLAVTKSVGALAKIVYLMGSWNGDPLDALSYTNTFGKAEAESKTSIDTLFAYASKLLSAQGGSASGGKKT